ncbi:unnamed protein product [Blepharisma stoltei]|uniref:Tyrosine specific protein phosphatases domain-containing protein n=1 Tax=Blepharisma stoltei TaxID=1481888 RepID=A0AAU9JIQ1_9CILI|nr:unnamed protein product [Blepharisma stoltei]
MEIEEAKTESKGMKYCESLHFFRVLNGSIACSPRPTLKAIQLFRKLSLCTTVVTLLSPSETPNQIKRACKAQKLKWTWIPIKAVSRKLLHEKAIHNDIKKGLLEVRNHLMNGEKILIHCAAGIHRTGAFTYTLLRISGLSQDEAFSAIREIREETRMRCGIHRFAIGEVLAKMITEDLPVQIVEEVSLGIPETDYLSNKENPLFWIRVEKNECLVKVSCCMTNFDVKKIIPGFEVFAQVEDTEKMFSYRFLRNFERRDGIEIKPLSEVNNLINEFVRSSTPAKHCIMSGILCHIDREFVYKFMPDVLSHLHYRIIDIGTFYEEMNKDIPTTQNLVEDLQLFLSLKQNYFK